MRHGYVVPMRWMVIYGYGVPGGALNLNSTNYPDHGHHGDPPLSGKNTHGRAGNRTRDLTISSQKRWPLDHKAGHLRKYMGGTNWKVSLFIYIQILYYSTKYKHLRCDTSTWHLCQQHNNETNCLWLLQPSLQSFHLACLIHISVSVIQTIPRIQHECSLTASR
jgi:hypothetical protein